MQEIITVENSGEEFSRKYYKRLVAHIQKLKKLQNDKDNAIREVRSYVAANISPFVLKLTEIKLEVLKMLDKTYQRGFLTFWEKTKLHELILERASDLSIRHQCEEAVPIFQAYKDNAPDQAFKDLANFSETLFKSFWGEVLDGYAWQEKEIQKTNESKQYDLSEAQDETQSRQYEAEIQSDTELKLAQTLKSLYTKLAKKLHPDLEADEEKKREKTEQMQHITFCYKNGDVFELLRLAVEHDCTDFESFEAQDLEEITLLLKKQARALEKSLAHFETEEDATLYHAFCRGGKVDYGAIEEQKKMILFECGRVKADLEKFASESALRNYLRSF